MKQGTNLRTRGTYLLLLLIWLLAVGVSGWFALQWHHRQSEREFNARFQELARALDAGLNVNAAVMEGAAALVGAHHRLKRPALRHQLRGLLRRFPHVQALRVYVANRPNVGPRLLVHESIHEGDHAWANAGASHENLHAAVAQALSDGTATASGPIPGPAGSAGYALVRRVYGDGLRMAVTLIVALPSVVTEHAAPHCAYRVRLVHEAAPSAGREVVMYKRYNGSPGPVDAMSTRSLARSHRFSAAGQPFRLEADCNVGWQSMDGELVTGLGVGATGGLLLAFSAGGAVERRRRGKEEAQRRLFYLANFDTVTGLPNRNLLRDRLRQAIARARRSDRPLVLLYMDMDGFKAVNDTAGHEAGDQVLVQIAKRLSDIVRDEDTVGRLSGDEFVILLENLDSEELVQVVTRKIQDAMEVPFRVRGLTFLLGVSIGSAWYPQDGASASDLLNHADLEMYAEKYPDSPLP